MQVLLSTSLPGFVDGDQLGTPQQFAKLTVTQLQLTTSVVEFDSVVTDLGVVLDNQLSMSP